MSTHALASLTATYTDSEPEGDEEEDDEPLQEDKKSPIDEEHVMSIDSLNTNSYMSNQDILGVTNKVARLVSYNDDTVISDEEHEDNIVSVGERQGHEQPEVEDKKGEKTTNDVELPPEPTGRCSPRLQEKVCTLLGKLEAGLDMNNTIQSRKDFRNPSIYEKLILFCGINELGTNYPPNIYDPLKWGKESYYEELAKVQKAEMDKREKEKKERTKVEIVSGTAKKTNVLTSEEEMKRRKSKWDQVGTSASNLLSSLTNMVRPAGLIQPSLTSSATGTKGTVISAFGSLPKKPRL